MRKVYSFIIVYFLVCISLSAQITWDGEGGDGQWSTASNWVGDIVPGPANDVLLDNSVVTSGYSVTLPSGAVSTSVNSLIINPALGSVIIFTLPQSNTAAVGFTATGSGDAIVINGGAIFFNSSGASAGTPVTVTATGFFRINNNGRYIHNTDRGHTNFLVSRLSTAVGTEDGIFEFDTPGPGSYLVSASGRTYGNLVFSANAAAGAKTYWSTGINTLTINGDLTLYSDVTYEFQITNNIDVRKDLNLFPGSTLNISDATSNNNTVLSVDGDIDISGSLTETGSGLPKIILAGVSNQNITATGSVNNSINLELNNPAGATLLSSLLLPFSYTITSGNLILGNNNFLTPVINLVGVPSHTGNHIVTNGTGVLTIPSISTTPTIFPIGPSIDSLNALTINTSIGANSFSARVEKGINPGVAFPTYGINRTWHINSTTTVTNVVIGFQYATTDANPGASAQPQLMELLFNNTISDPLAWNVILQNLSPLNFDPYWLVGGGPVNTITNIPFSYALGITGGWILPIDCIVTAHTQKTGNNALIRWEINSCTEVTDFELQRSLNAGNFVTIRSIVPGSQLNYDYTDVSLGIGTNLYRIKVNRTSGAIKYSNTVSIINDPKGLLITSLTPNPVHDKTVMTLSAANHGKISFHIYNVSGRLVKQFETTVIEGSNAIILELGELPAGSYLIEAIGLETRSVSRFLKL